MPENDRFSLRNQHHQSKHVSYRSIRRRMTGSVTVDLPFKWERAHIYNSICTMNNNLNISRQSAQMKASGLISSLTSVAVPVICFDRPPLAASYPGNAKHTIHNGRPLPQHRPTSPFELVHLRWSLDPQGHRYCPTPLCWTDWRHRTSRVHK